VRPSSDTKVSVPLVLPKNRHPERSASHIYRVIQRLERGVEGPRRCFVYLCCSELFTTELPPGKLITVFPCGREAGTCVSQQILLSGFCGQKAPSSTGKIVPPRSFDCAPQAVCRAMNL
jgi:hypothetical protein